MPVEVKPCPECKGEQTVRYGKREKLCDACKGTGRVDVPCGEEFSPMDAYVCAKCGLTEAQRQAWNRGEGLGRPTLWAHGSLCSDCANETGICRLCSGNGCRTCRQTGEAPLLEGVA